jgi:hypothetical protein
VDPEGDPDVPQSRTPPRQPRTRFWQTRPARDNPARQYNRPADAKLLDVPGLLIVDDPIARWLPELAAPVVVRTPAAPIDDVVPVVRPIAVEDLLAFRAGWGWTRGTCRAGTDGSAAQGPRRT